MGSDTEKKIRTDRVGLRDRLGRDQGGFPRIGPENSRCCRHLGTDQDSDYRTLIQTKVEKWVGGCRSVWRQSLHLHGTWPGPPSSVIARATKNDANCADREMVAHGRQTVRGIEHLFAQPNSAKGRLQGGRKCQHLGPSVQDETSSLRIHHAPMQSFDSSAAAVRAVSIRIQSVGRAGVVIGLLASASTVVRAEPAAPMDPLSVAPFRWQEILRGDLRPNSPVTEGTFLFQPVAPIGLGSNDTTLAVLAVYRHDRLTPRAGLVERDLHRFELGAPLAFRLAPDWAFELDIRGVYASSLERIYGLGFYPNLRSAVTWSLSSDFAIALHVIYTYGGLGLVPVPAMGLAWRPDPRLRIEGLLPRFVELGYRPTQRVEVFVAGHWEAGVWATTDATSGTRNLLTRQEVRAQAGLRARLFGPLGLEVSTHWVPFQELERNGDRTRPQSIDDVSLTVGIVLDRVFARALAQEAVSPSSRAHHL